MLGGRGTGLMVLGAALLLVSVTMFGYSRFVEWQHAQATRSLAPPTEVLANRLPIPTPLTTSSASPRATVSGQP